ncbi:MAG: hypothetical protein O9327_15100 [Polaromonas sp.]|nr:hypothetical protein [Polaromonas sp.]
MKVAPPEAGDVAALVELARVCHGESRFAHLPYCAGRVAARFTTMIEQPRTATFFVAARTSPGDISGLMIGAIDEYFFCEERVASSIFFLVHPAHRGGLSASKMVLAFRAWAQARGAAEIYIGVASGVSIHRTGRFLSKLGLSLSGGNYADWLPPLAGNTGAR